MTLAERLEGLVAQWDKMGDDFEVTLGDSQVEDAYHACAYELGTALAAATVAEAQTGGADSSKLWRISQAVKLQNQNDLAGLQQFYDYVKGVVGGEGEGGAT